MERGLRIHKPVKGASPVRNFGPALLILISVAQSMAAPSNAVHSTSSPQPGILLLLGAGLTILASLVRRRFSE